MPNYKGSLHSKLPRVKQSIFTKMSQMALKENALNLSQGFPDFHCHPDLVGLVAEKMKAGLNQYAPMSGVHALKLSIAEKTEKLYTGKYNPETEICVTAGATQAIFTAISATVNEGDEVLIFTPAYDCYEPAVELNGGKPVFVQLKGPEYRINWEEVKKLISQRTKMIIINTPHNPSGTIMSMQDMLQLEKLTDNSDILVLSDEVYEHIIFDGYEHQSVARFPKLASRSFIISSLGKSYHTTGWKIGYCLAPEKLMKEFYKAHQYNVFSVNTPIQHAYAEFIKREGEYLKLKAFYQAKRDLFNQLIKNSKFICRPSMGTYFQLLDYSRISDENDEVFAETLTRKFKIASIPVSVFYNKAADEKVLRFCFAKEDETLEKAAGILNSIS